MRLLKQDSSQGSRRGGGDCAGEEPRGPERAVLESPDRLKGGEEPRGPERAVLESPDRLKGGSTRTRARN